MIHCPRLTIAGLGGDTGKTSISVGLCRAWQKKGYKVIPFKKGPDYIDMGWLSRGAGHPCYNFDLFLMSKDQVLSSFALNTKQAEIAVIEGNRGLYDGMDVEGSVSTAELAKLLQSPVVLIVDCTKVTRTVAALVLGCKMFDPDVQIKGVILNWISGLRHETIICKSIEYYCHLPVVGAIPRLTNITFPGRHLGLVPPQEHPMAEEAIAAAAEMVKKYLDLRTLWEIAKEASPLEVTPPPIPPLPEGRQAGPRGRRAREGVRIGIIRDSAFQFYYQENLDALKRAGARLTEFSALTDDLPPELDVLYIGGGFPETHAAALSANEKLRKAIKKSAENGLPIYAECGGLMYLGEELIWEGKTYPMAGVLPIVIGVSEKPQGHGYSIIEVEAPNPYFKTGQILHGHEFHYSRILNVDEILRLTKYSENNPPSPPFSKGGQGGFSEQKDSVYFAFKLKRGHGIINKMDGLCYKNVLATYTHLHALGTREWVDGIINMAAAYKRK
ncbi:MAG: cobyrinate a,c-diamide synthase [Nitrospirota bacterium]|nr:cobyrinate a,c-diamide synthase [Nitrospirota bacterium]